jgi:sugar phosphate isomerase/epimerase
MAADGVQIEAVHALLRRQPDQTLKTLAEIGFRGVEGYRRAETVALAPKLKEYGLAIRSCQFEVPLITQYWDLYPEFPPIPLPEAIDGVAAAGAAFFTMTAIHGGARGDGDDFYRRTADRMNAAGELCRKARIRFAWSANALDFEGRPGMRAIDIYRERLDPKLAPVEFDTAQLIVAHQDAARLLKDWKGRVAMLRVSPQAPAPLEAAESAGVEFAFMGLNEESADPLQALRSAFQISTGSG